MHQELTANEWAAIQIDLERFRVASLTLDVPAGWARVGVERSGTYVLQRIG
jgi:uncharacterized protein YbdZ (MbtH family)